MSQYPVRIETTSLPPRWHRNYDHVAPPESPQDADFPNPASHSRRTAATNVRSYGHRPSRRLAYSTRYDLPTQLEAAGSIPYGEPYFRDPRTWYPDTLPPPPPPLDDEFNFGGHDRRVQQHISPVQQSPTSPPRIRRRKRVASPRVSPSRERYSRQSRRYHARVSSSSDSDAAGNSRSRDRARLKREEEGFVADDGEELKFEEDLVLVGDRLRPRPSRQHTGLQEAFPVWDGHDAYYDNNSVFYSFTGPESNVRRGSVQGGGSGLSDNESTVAVDEEHEVPEPDAMPVEHGAAAYHVLESQYAGDGYEEGHHSVKLTAVLSERAVVPQSLFRWVYDSPRR